MATSTQTLDQDQTALLRDRLRGCLGMFMPIFRVNMVLTGEGHDRLQM